jgi:AcrR family transcriptional regulator
MKTPESGTVSARRPGRPAQPVPRSVFLAAARQVFAEDGYDGATVARIAEVAGVTKAAVLHHFESKEALYALTLSAIADDLGRLVAAAAAEPGDLGARLDALGAHIVRALGADPHAARLLVREFVDARPHLDRSESGYVARAVNETRALLAAGIASGEIVAQDPGHLAGSIIGLHLFWFAAPVVTGRLVDGEPTKENVVEARVWAVQAQVRRLCGLPPDAAAAGSRTRSPHRSITPEPRQ